MSVAYPSDFQDIAPCSDVDFKDTLVEMAEQPGFEHAMKYVIPESEYPEFKRQLLSSQNINDFQHRIAGGFLEYLAKKTTAGVSTSGFENIDGRESHMFISNHRDIVLDAAFLNLCFIRHNKPITQVAIGNNLLIYDWIRNLVRLNRSFIVKRNIKPLQALAAAKQLSAYIHYVITQRNESIWIAQREGRAKDSSDVTQESLLKMLTLGGGNDAKEAIMELNIVPVSISYEYDPNDYLKAREFLMRRRDPDFKKSQHDDLFSMETGILQFKGKVHFTLNAPINKQLGLCTETNRNDVVRVVREIIDREIHSGYQLYPINYIAYDELNGTNQFGDRYNSDEQAEVDAYFAKQEQRVEVENMNDEEKAFVHRLFLKMYANPLINKLETQG